MSFELQFHHPHLCLYCFVVAALGWGYKKTNLLGIGLALWVLSILITQVHIG
ncbi:MAG: hypothetical protein WCC30_04195 [Candidatus Dormiibacterota bacterium]